MIVTFFDFESIKKYVFFNMFLYLYLSIIALDCSRLYPALLRKIAYSANILQSCIPLLPLVLGRPTFRESLYISTRRTVNSAGNFVTTWRGLESLVIEGARANRLARAHARDAGLSASEGADQLLQLEPIGIFSVIVSNA